MSTSLEAKDFIRCRLAAIADDQGRVFKVTRERVRQIQVKALIKLQHPVRAARLVGLLDGAGQ